MLWFRKLKIALFNMFRKLRIALTIRYVFNNWFLLLIKYALTRLGFNVKLVARVGDCVFELRPETFEMFAISVSHGLVKSVECVGGRLFVNGVEVDSIDGVFRNVETWAKMFGWVYDLTNGFWFKDGARFRHMYWLILEVFDYGTYEPLNVNGRVVVDVGAYIGDSAIYFAYKGAKKVIAIEPHPGAYVEMLENIRLNNLEGVVVPVNDGLASRPGRICIKEVGVEDTFNTYHRPGDCLIAVPAVTLGELIDKFGVDPNDAVLKMDCEGCEYDVILNDYGHVKLFRELILEYHLKPVNKSLDDLLNVLSRDYECDVYRRKDNGIMHCIRK
jgi:FkbM family methyltransferase